MNENAKIFQLINATINNNDSADLPAMPLLFLSEDYLKKVSKQFASLITKSLNGDKTSSANYLKYLSLLVQKPDRHYSLDSNNLDVVLETFPLASHQECPFKDAANEDFSKNLSVENYIDNFYSYKMDLLKLRKGKTEFVRQNTMDGGSDFGYSSQKALQSVEKIFPGASDANCKGSEDDLQEIKLAMALINLQNQSESACNVIYNVVLHLKHRKSELKLFQVDFLYKFYKKIVFNKLYTNCIESQEDFLESFPFLLEKTLIELAQKIIKGCEVANEENFTFLMIIINCSPEIKLKIVSICYDLFILSNCHVKMVNLLQLFQ